MITFDYGVDLYPLDSSMKETIRHWRNNPLIYKYCRQNDLITDLDQNRWFEKQSQDPKIKMYLMRSSQPIGVCGLTDIDHFNSRAEFSLYVAPEYQCHGFGFAGLKTLFSHGFYNLNLNLIWGETFDGNHALNLFKKLGMTQEGTRRQYYFKNGSYIDAHLVSITRDEWNTQLLSLDL